MPVPGPGGMKYIVVFAGHQLGTDIQRGYTCAAVQALNTICDRYSSHSETYVLLCFLNLLILRRN